MVRRLLHTGKRAAATVEITGALVLAGILVHVVPLRWTVRAFGRIDSPGDERVAAWGEDMLRRGRAVARRTHRLAERLPWTSRCLVQALALALLLRRRGILGATIRFGVRKEGDTMTAHAWLLLGEEVVIGGMGAERYRPLADWRWRGE